MVLLFTTAAALTLAQAAPVTAHARQAAKTAGRQRHAPAAAGGGVDYCCAGPHTPSPFCRHGGALTVWRLGFHCHSPRGLLAGRSIPAYFTLLELLCGFHTTRAAPNLLWLWCLREPAWQDLLARTRCTCIGRARSGPSAQHFGALGYCLILLFLCHVTAPNRSGARLPPQGAPGPSSAELSRLERVRDAGTQQ